MVDANSKRSKTKSNTKPAKTAPKINGPKPGTKSRPDRDRRVRQADRLARILRVLELIQSRGRWTTKAIADEIECSENSSAIRPRKDWQDNIRKGVDIFKKKHGYLPAWQGAVPDTAPDQVKKIMKNIYKKYAKRS